MNPNFRLVNSSKMSAKIKCAEYSYVTRRIWDLTEEEEKALMTLPLAKIKIVEPEPEKNTNC